MGIDLLRGRPFTIDEAVTPNSSSIISRSAAARLWPDRDPIGRRVRRADGDVQWFTVVGLVEDVKQEDWRDAGEAIVYFPLTGPTPAAWALGSPASVVKSPRAASLGREVRELVRQVAPEAPVYREFTMELLAQRSMVQLSFTMLTLGVISALAMILGVVGLYGVDHDDRDRHAGELRARPPRESGGSDRIAAQRLSPAGTSVDAGRPRSTAHGLQG